MRFETLLMVILVSGLVWGCGTDRSNHRSSPAGDPASGDATGYAQDLDVESSGEISAEDHDLGTTHKIAEDATTLRLLHPTELDTKTSDIFGGPWMVEVRSPTEEDPERMEMVNGFEVFSANLNGIDYDSVNEYSTIGSAIFVTTHEKFCREMTEAAFADDTRRQRFFVEAAETDTMAGSPTETQDNLGHIMVMMLGQSDQDSELFAELVGFYEDLEQTTPEDRNQKHPLELTVASLCFTSAFIHTYY